MRPERAGTPTKKKWGAHSKSPVGSEAKTGVYNVGLLGAKNGKPMVYDMVPKDESPKS